MPKSKRQKCYHGGGRTLVHIKQSEYHMNKLKKFKCFVKKDLAIVAKVTEENFIELFI